MYWIKHNKTRVYFDSCWIYRSIYAVQNVCPLLSSQFSKCWHVSMWLMELLWLVTRWDYLQCAIMRWLGVCQLLLGLIHPLGHDSVEWQVRPCLMSRNRHAHLLSSPHSSWRRHQRDEDRERPALQTLGLSLIPTCPPLQTHTNNSCLPRRQGERTMSKSQTECLFHAGSTATSKLCFAPWLINL